MFPGLKETPATRWNFLTYCLPTADGKLTAGKDVKVNVKAEILDHVQGDKVIALK